MKKHNVALFAILSMTSLTATIPAYAYLDPGTGSMLLQLMLGGVAVAMIVGKLYFQKLTDIFRGNTQTDQNDASEEQEDTNRKLFDVCA
jgi:hypothetical protein